MLLRHVLRDHVALGIFAACSAWIVLEWTWWQCGLFWLASILIDIDHYIHFVWVTRGKRFWSVAGMFRYHEGMFNHIQTSNYLSLEIFHTIEFMILVGALAFGLWDWLQPVFWGFVFHILVDVVCLGRQGMLFKRAHSFVEYGVRRGYFYRP